MRANTISKIAKMIAEEMKGLNTVRIMHLCGTHEDTIMRYNLRSLMPKNLKLLSGPGCPVCIIPDSDLQAVFHLVQQSNIVLTTFGDMARVPLEGKSLLYLKSKGYNIRIVYSVFDALEIAKKSDKPVVHFGIGFETTMPSTSLAILDGVKNFYVFSSHRFFLPAMKHLISSKIKVDGFINPGHVSTIVGVKAYEKIKEIPQVIAGFEPEDVMLAIYLLVKLIKDGKSGVFNEYTRAVNYEGNLKAQKVIDEVFRKVDCPWRGLGIVKNSGGKIKKKYEDYDALKVFEDVFSNFEVKEDPRKRACRCGDVLKGLIEPPECPLFNKMCNPKNPVGPCMVSVEGACNIWVRTGC